MHNIPEGMAIGTISQMQQVLGLEIAIVMCLHNIPEGMAITLPLVAGGMNKIVAIVLSIIAGSMTIVGGVIGAIVGGISSTATSFFLAFAAGAMLQVTMCEMLPDLIKLHNDKNSFYYVLCGILIGFVITFIA